MTVRVAAFAGEYEQLGALTGESVEELRAQEDLHSGDRPLWLAWRGEQLVGAMHPWRRPDGKLTFYYGPCSADAFAPLAAAVPGEAYTVIGEVDTAPLLAAGFEITRRELQYRLPVSRFSAPVPAGISLLSAADVPLEPLMHLDCALREDVPGGAGWQPDPVWFREETYDSPYFDPALYLVARDDAAAGLAAHPTATGPYVGLCRVWTGPELKLGMIGLLPAFRGRGVAKAMLARVFAVLADRGIEAVASDTDESNGASRTLQESLGATTTSITVELRRSA